MKTGKLKICKRDAKTLRPLAEKYMSAAEKLEKLVLTLGGKQIRDIEGKVIFDGANNRRKICKGDKKLMEAADRIYTYFVNGKMTMVDDNGKVVKHMENGKEYPLAIILGSNSFALGFLGGRSKSDSFGRAKPENIPLLKLFRKDLELLEKHKILPLATNVTIAKSHGTYKKSITKVVQSRISSYETQIISTKEEYDALTENIGKLENKLITRYSDKELSDLGAFIGSSLKLNHRVNFKFISYVETDPSLPEKGKWKDKGKLRVYRCKSEVIKLLKKYPSIWKDENSILFDDSLKSYLELLDQKKRKKEFPSYTMISMATGAMALSSIGNAITIQSITQIGDQIVWKLMGPKGLKDTIEFVTNHRRIGRGKRYYFQDLKVETIDNKHHFSFSINGRQPFAAIVNEPSIYFREKGAFVAMPMQIQKSEEVIEQEKNLNKIRNYLRRSYPEMAKISGRQKSLTPIAKDQSDFEELVSKIGGTLNVMGVDLGLIENACSVLSFDGNIEKVIHGDVKEGDRTERMTYVQLVKKINALQNDIDNTSFWYKEADDSIIKNEEYLKWLKSNKSTINLEKLSSSRDWQCAKEFSAIRKEFLNLIAVRNKSYDWMNAPFWANLIKRFISLHKSYFTVGKTLVEDNKAMFDTSGICKKYNEMYRNSKEDFAKKLASYIVQIAIKQNVHIISVEKLLSNLGSKDKKTRRDNEMFLAWNCGRIKYHLENMANDYGILLDEVSEFDTSQVHYETQNRGWRDVDDSRVLWCEKNGKLISVPANLNAAQNIASRLINKHSTFFSLSVVKVDDKTVEVSYAEESKRLRGAVTKEFGYSNVQFPFSIDNKKSRLFRYNGKWISETENTEYIQSIRDKVTKLHS
jgi:IS605 OrfB family transposase